MYVVDRYITIPHIYTGFVHPNMSPTYKKWSGGGVYIAVGCRLGTKVKKEEETYFRVQNRKTIVCKCVCRGKTHKCTKGGFMIEKYVISF
jgi:hypothetical protein